MRNEYRSIEKGLMRLHVNSSLILQRKVLSIYAVLLRETLGETKRARSRQPPSAVTYEENSQQRIFCSVLILST